MTRLEYLKALETALKLHLSREEINDIMRDYGEYFNEGEQQGKNEWEIIISLGNPREVARQIIDESLAGEPRRQAAYYATSAAKNAANVAKDAAKGIGGAFSGTAWKIGLVLLAIIASPIIFFAAIAVFGTIFSVLFAIIAVVVSFFAIILCGVALAVAAIMVATALPGVMTGMLIVAAVGMIAGGVLGATLFIMLMRVVIKYSKKLCVWFVGKGWKNSNAIPSPYTYQQKPSQPPTYQKEDEKNA